MCVCVCACFAPQVTVQEAKFNYVNLIYRATQNNRFSSSDDDSLKIIGVQTVLLMRYKNQQGSNVTHLPPLILGKWHQSRIWLFTSAKFIGIIWLMANNQTDSRPWSVDDSLGLQKGYWSALFTATRKLWSSSSHLHHSCDSCVMLIWRYSFHVLITETDLLEDYFFPQIPCI